MTFKVQFLYLAMNNIELKLITFHIVYNTNTYINLHPYIPDCFQRVKTKGRNY